MNLTHNEYTIQGIPVKDIATQYGTPLYVYDAAKIIEQIALLKKSFAGVYTRIKYAAKALTNISILKLMKNHGVGVDVVSVNEGRLALYAGFDAHEIMYTPNCVDFEEVVDAVNLGFSINLDNLSVLEEFSKRYGNKKPCALRINPGIMAGGNYKISTGHTHSKFGISIQQLPEVLHIIKKYNTTVNGLHVHTGSEVVDVEVFLKVADVLFDVAMHFSQLVFIDFGGGFKVAYKQGDSTTNIEKLGAALADAFRTFCNRYGRELELWIEPGKFLVSEAGYLVTKTTVVKETPVVTFAGVNSGLNHLIRPMMYDAYHHIINVSNPHGNKKKYTVVGFICETDTLGAEREINEIHENDLLVFCNAGAYGFSMSSNYNSRLRPAEVLIENAHAKLIRKREIFEDLLRGQIE